MKSSGAAASQGSDRVKLVFPALFGAFLGICLLKFGNPPIMEKWVARPGDLAEFVLGSPWPISWAYLMLGIVLILGLSCRPGWAGVPWWLLAAPLGWLLLTTASATHTIASDLTPGVVVHFYACAVCFFLGLTVLSRIPHRDAFWPCLIAGFIFVLTAGWSQQFGGLEQTRKYFYAYIYPQLKVIPPDYLKKVASTRIFSTLFYPNSLACVLLLLLPPLSVFLFLWERRFTLAARVFMAAAILGGGLACLFWSGSKAGWLLMVLELALALLLLPTRRQLKIGFIVLLVTVGSAGFIYKYSGFFAKGATSVSARFDYWRAALAIARENPLLGTGPGSFGVSYARIKDPASEPARLAHNDYLEQAADSGVPAALCYSAFIWATLLWSFPLRRKSRAQQPGDAPPPAPDWQTLAAWIGVFAWACHSFVEFNLYIPAVSWPAFAILGLLAGRKRIDTAAPHC